MTTRRPSDAEGRDGDDRTVKIKGDYWHYRKVSGKWRRFKLEDPSKKTVEEEITTVKKDASKALDSHETDYNNPHQVNVNQLEGDTFGGVLYADDFVRNELIDKTQTIMFPEFIATYNWTSAPSMANDGATNGYAYAQSSIAAGPVEWVTGTWLIPDDWEPGTAITVDVGFGVSSSSPAQANVDITCTFVAHSHNSSADPSNYLGREYSSARGVSWVEQDVVTYSQTYGKKEGIVMTSDGTLNSNALYVGDMVHMSFGFAPGTTNPTSATSAHVTYIKVHYKAASNSHI